MFRKLIAALALSALLAPFAAVFAQEAAPAAPARDRRTVILATTTSVQDSGLLDLLVDAFQKASGYLVKAVAVGSGQAMQLGRMGEADLMWVHSPDDERQFVAEGYGTDRTAFMYNDFVVLGPLVGPAKIKKSKKAAETFAKISAAGALFVSRGDKSGTHKKELKLWEQAKVKPAGEKYLETGQGMAASVKIASEKGAYVLADRSTWLSLQKDLALRIVCEKDEALLNRYSLILVNPARHRNINAGGARAFFDFLLSKQTRAIVERFGVEKHGRPLFNYDYPR